MSSLLYQQQSNIDTPTSGTLSTFVNLLKPTGYMMHHQVWCTTRFDAPPGLTHHQVNIQQLYTVPTLYVLYLSENKQQLVPLES
jgi:hypothetical protein